MDFEINTLWIERLLKKTFHENCLIGDKRYYDPHYFAVAKELEDNFEYVQKELLGILERYDGFAPFQTISPDQTYISNDDKWRMFFFKGAGINFKRNQSFAPMTMEILNRHKYVISAYISVLGPNKMLMPHEGPWSGIFRMHLGVKIPGKNQCALVVGGETYHWEEGKTVLFDDTYEHIAANMTDEIRAVLFLDIMRPLKQPWAAINWTVLKLSRIFPYVWIPYFRHKKWEKEFYSEDKCKSQSSRPTTLMLFGRKLKSIWQALLSTPTGATK